MEGEGEGEGEALLVLWKGESLRRVAAQACGVAAGDPRVAARIRWVGIRPPCCQGVRTPSHLVC